MTKSKPLSRRDFLKLAGVISTGLALSACGVKATELPTATPNPTNTIAPTLTSTPYPTATPRPLTLRSVGEMLGVNFGTTAGGDEPYNDPRYKKAARENFSVLFDAGGYFQSTFDRYGYGGADAIRRMTLDNGQILHIHPVFWGCSVQSLFYTCPKNLNQATREQVIEYMEDRIRLILSRYVRKVETGAKPTYINFINEAFWEDPSPRDPKRRFGYQRSPFQKAFSDKRDDSDYPKDNHFISQTYLIFYYIAKDLDLEIGKDFRMIYSDFGVHTPSGKTDFIVSELKRAKAEIAQAIDKVPEDIQLDTAIQTRLYLSNRPWWQYRDFPTEDELAAAIEQFKEVGRVHLTEVTVIGAENGSQITNTLKMINRVAVKTRCDSVNYWFGFKFMSPEASPDPTGYFPLGLFDTEYQMTNRYRELMQGLVELLGK